MAIVGDATVNFSLTSAEEEAEAAFVVCSGCYVIADREGEGLNCHFDRRSESNALDFFMQDRPWQSWTSCEDRKRQRRKRVKHQHLSPVATGAKTLPLPECVLVKMWRGSSVQLLWILWYSRLKLAEKAAARVVTFDLWLHDWCIFLHPRTLFLTFPHIRKFQALFVCHSVNSPL